MLPILILSLLAASASLDAPPEIISPSDPASWRALPGGYALPGGECSGQAIVGTRGETISVSRPSNAYCVKSDGTLVWLSANQIVAAIVNGRPSARTEISRTNLVPRSQEFEQAVWAKGNSTVTANSITAPDGTLTADILVDTAVAGSHRIIQGPISVTASGNYTWSAFGKAGALNFMGIGSDNSVRRAVVNLSNGVVSNVSAGTTARATPYVAGWWRLEVTGAAEADGTEYVSVYLADTAANADPLSGTYTGTGTGTISIWGYQLEAGLTASSYYPTAAAAATRSPDVISISTPAGLPASGWCMGVRIAPFTTWSGAENETVLTGGTFGTANAFSVYLNFPNALVVQQWNGAGNQTSVTTSVLSQNPHDLVIRHTGTAIDVVIDGVVAATTTGVGDGTVSAWPATVYVGNDSTGIGAIGQTSNVRFGKTTYACER